MPLDLGAKGSCQVGGNVSTNAGGLRYLRYYMVVVVVVVVVIRGGGGGGGRGEVANALSYLLA